MPCHGPNGDAFVRIAAPLDPTGIENTPAEALKLLQRLNVGEWAVHEVQLWLLDHPIRYPFLGEIVPKQHV
jgi:hypothetical protein